MNVRFVIRGFLLALPVALIVLAAGVYLQSPLSRAPEPTPPPPIIDAARGPIPAGPVALREYARYRGGTYQPVGSGFFLSLESGEVVAVTPAHSVSLDQRQNPLESIALGVDGQAYPFYEFDTLWGAPGGSLTPTNLALDYLLLRVDGSIESRFLLRPDPRGGPQLGERVLVYSGVAGRGGEPRVLPGTVQSATATAVWVLMDDLFNPSQMSGSPLISQHTGRVVGMVLALSPRRTRFLIGAHPIGSLVQLAETASEFPRLGE
ncbi:MAG: serine protease [Anaerolineae bacterium]|jgi:hypothetical protein